MLLLSSQFPKVQSCLIRIVCDVSAGYWNRINFCQTIWSSYWGPFGPPRGAMSQLYCNGLALTSKLESELLTVIEISIRHGPGAKKSLRLESIDANDATEIGRVVALPARGTLEGGLAAGEGSMAAMDPSELATKSQEVSESALVTTREILPPKDSGWQE